MVRSLPQKEKYSKETTFIIKCLIDWDPDSNLSFPITLRCSFFTYLILFLLKYLAYISLGARLNMTLKQLVEVACQKKQLNPAEYCLKLNQNSFMINLDQTLDSLITSLINLGQPTVQLHLVKATEIEQERGF